MKREKKGRGPSLKQRRVEADRAAVRAAAEAEARLREEAERKVVGRIEPYFHRWSDRGMALAMRLMWHRRRVAALPRRDNVVPFPSDASEESAS